MRLPRIWGLYLLSACHTPSQNLPAAPLRYGHLTLSAETIPVWDDTCLQESSSFSAWAVSVVLQRDRVSDMPEWVSGHRFALTAACETFSPRLLIIETPATDSAFYPADSLSQIAWQAALRTWLLDELLPFLSTYPATHEVAWGRGFAHLPLPERFWEDLMREARQSAPHLKWGLITDDPARLPLPQGWSFIGLFRARPAPGETPTSSTIYLLPPSAEGRSLPPAEKDVVGYVFYSESYLPLTCR